MKKIALFFAFALFQTLTVVAQNGYENLKINWPEEYKWKVGSNQENEQVHMVEVVPGNESVEKWTILGTMMSIKGAVGVPMDVAMDMMFKQTKESSDNSKLSLIEKGETWILFKIETASFHDDKNPESQLYYIVQGKTSLYSNFVAIKERSLSPDFVNKWSKVFKASELVYQ